MKRDKIEKIYSIVQEEMGVSRRQIFSKNRTRDIVNARRIISLVLLDNKVCTLTLAAEIINRDHSVVSHYKRTTRPLLETEKELMSSYKRVNIRFKMHLDTATPEEIIEELVEKQKELQEQIEELKKEIEFRNLYL